LGLEDKAVSRRPKGVLDGAELILRLLLLSIVVSGCATSVHGPMHEIAAESPQPGGKRPCDRRVAAGS